MSTLLGNARTQGTIHGLTDWEGGASDVSSLGNASKEALDVLSSAIYEVIDALVGAVRKSDGESTVGSS